MASPETLFADVESALCRLIRWALLWRIPQAANLADLAARSVLVLSDWALCFVVSEGRVYEWDPDSQAQVNPPFVVTSDTLAPGAFGRWGRVETALAYGAGGVNLGVKQTGYLRSVATWESDDGVDATIERVYDNLPAVLVQFTGDDPVSGDNTPGAFYLDTLNFSLLILSQNLRGSPSPTQGPRMSSETADDPGAYRIVGDLRRVMCGLSLDSEIEGVERIEIGASELAFEDIDRRVYVWKLAVRVKASFEITDEDLVTAAVRATPVLTECWPEERFDKHNFVGTGGGFTDGAGPGLGRTIEATLAIVQGVAVSVASVGVVFPPDKDTYRFLDSLGAWTFVAVEHDAAPPSGPLGALRVAVSRTDSGEVLYDRALCSFAIALPPPIDS
jgi:phage gp37-like protein